MLTSGQADRWTVREIREAALSELAAGFEGGPDTPLVEARFFEAAEREAASLRQAAELARHWFRNFEQKPPDEGIDLTGIDTCLRKLDAALSTPEDTPTE